MAQTRQVVKAASALTVMGFTICGIIYAIVLIVGPERAARWMDTLLS